MSNLAFSKTRRTDTPSSALERVEIAIHTTIERHSTISIEDDDSRTIISTSEQTPDIVGHSSKVSLVEYLHAHCQPSLSLSILQEPTTHTLFEFPHVVSGRLRPFVFFW